MVYNFSYRKKKQASLKNGGFKGPGNNWLFGCLHLFKKTVYTCKTIVCTNCDIFLFFFFFFYKYISIACT